MPEVKTLKHNLKKTFMHNQTLIIEACDMGYGDEVFVTRLREANDKILEKMKEFNYTI